MRTYITLLLFFSLSASALAQTFSMTLAAVDGNTAVLQMKISGATITGGTDCDIPNFVDDVMLGLFNFTIYWFPSDGVTNVSSVNESACTTGYGVGALGSAVDLSDGRKARAFGGPIESHNHPYSWTPDQFITICTLEISGLPPAPAGDDQQLGVNFIEIMAATDPLVDEANGSPVIQTTVNVNYDCVGSGDCPQYVPEVVDSQLPIELLSFTAQKKDDQSSILRWETSSEINTSHFLVQRSEDAREWTDIGAVDAAGQSFELKEYSFVDLNVYDGRRASQRFYYRLIMIDKDGKFDVSNIQAVKFTSETSGNTTVLVYPNPSSIGVNVEIAQNEGGAKPAQMEMFNNLGQLVFSRKLNENTEIEYIHYASEGIPSGAFFLRLSDKDGETISQDQIIVAR